MDAHYFAPFMGREIVMQFQTQRLGIEIRYQHAVHIGHLLAFEFDPALFLKVIQCFHHTIAISLMLFVKQVEVHRGPGSGTV